MPTLKTMDIYGGKEKLKTVFVMKLANISPINNPTEPAINPFGGVFLKPHSRSKIAVAQTNPQKPPQRFGRGEMLKSEEK